MKLRHLSLKRFQTQESHSLRTNGTLKITVCRVQEAHLRRIGSGPVRESNDDYDRLLELQLGMGKRQLTQL